MLIPFYIFSHEKRFEEYEQIKYNLEELLLQGMISEYTRCTILDMSNKVLEHIALKYSVVREGVKSVLGGRASEYEAKTIRNEGIEEGIEKGIKGTVSGVCCLTTG